MRRNLHQDVELDLGSATSPDVKSIEPPVTTELRSFGRASQSPATQAACAPGRFVPGFCGALAMLFLSWLSPASAVAAPPAEVSGPPAASGVVSYPAAFYAPGQPSSARDMIERTPGFVLDKGQGVRGFGGGGNVLIDGERPTSKSTPLDSILQRIAADSVERIDVIRGGAPGLEMQGQGVIANVIRKTGASTSQAIQLFSKTYFDGFLGGFVRAEAAWKSGGLSAEGQFSGRRDLAPDSGDGRLSRVRPGTSPYESGDFDARTAVQRYRRTSGCRGRSATERLGGAGHVEPTRTGPPESLG